MKTAIKLPLTLIVVGLVSGCVAEAYHASPTAGYSSTPHYGQHFHGERSIHNRVHRALRRAPGVPADHIRVYVSGRNVFLKGTVYNYRQKQRAHHVAHSVAGVNRVFVDDLRVANKHYW